MLMQGIPLLPTQRVSTGAGPRYEACIFDSQICGGLSELLSSWSLSPT